MSDSHKQASSTNILYRIYLLARWGQPISLYSPPWKMSEVYVKLRSHPQKHETNKEFKAILEILASWWQILRLGYMANKYLKDGWYDNLFRTSAIIPSVYNLQKMYWGDKEWRGYWKTASILLYSNIFWQISLVTPVLEFSSESFPRNTRSHTRSPRFYGPRNNTHRRLKSTKIERMIW